MSTTPTPRTDAELARLLSDTELTNIDRREAMAEFARLLERELVSGGADYRKLADDFAAVCKANGEHGDKSVSLLLANRELRRVIEARDADCQALRASLEAVAALAKEAAKK